MVSDVPLGAFLSGGVDSSAIVSYAREINPKINCFTINSSENKYSKDLDYAKRVSKILNLDLDIVSVSPTDLISSIKNMVYQLDEPLADPACLNVLFISQIARKKGIKVLLSGAGGDDLFTGYRRHIAMKEY